MIYRFADCELDTDRFELRRGGVVEPLEPQVFELLRHLVERYDRFVSKDEILAAVWQGRGVSDAALASRLRDARRAIGDNGAQQRLIRTVHGRGFRFVAPVARSGGTTGSDRDPLPSAAVGEAAAPRSQEIRYCTAGDGVRLYHTFSEIDLVPLLDQVRTPTLVIHARGDAVQPFEPGRRLPESIPGARFVPLDSRNHSLVPSEPAWPQMIAELRTFLGT